MEEPVLPYNKYGSWENGVWMPYDDMEAVDD